MEDKYNFYDKIVAATYVNIELQSPKDIYMSYNKDSYANKVFLKIGLLVANFTDKKLYVSCKFFDFLKILFYHYSIKDFLIGNCKLRFTHRKGGIWLNIDTIAAFEAEAFDTDIGIFEEIWKEYYQK